MTIVTLKGINHQTKQGQKGEYESVGILVDGSNGERWVNGYGTEQTRGWNKGDRVAINIDQNGEYWNFTPVGIDSLLLEILDKVSSITKTV